MSNKLLVNIYFHFWIKQGLLEQFSCRVDTCSYCWWAMLFLMFLTDSPDFPTPRPPITATFTIFFCFREKLLKKLKGEVVLLEDVDFDAIWLVTVCSELRNVSPLLNRLVLVGSVCRTEAAPSSLYFLNSLMMNVGMYYLPTGQPLSLSQYFSLSPSLTSFKTLFYVFL